MHSREAIALASIVALAIATVLAVDPRGEFPLNDDWCYATAVRHLVAYGEIRLVDWGSMALLTQLLWGGAFSLAFGFSFETLRASTLVLGLVAVLALYGIARELGATRALASLTALALLATPLFVLLAHTFMTDVPFLAFSLAALYMLLRGILRESRTELAAGLGLALAATLTRQLGLSLMVGFAAATLWRDWRKPRQWVVALAPLVAGYGLLRLYEEWLERERALPGAYNLPLLGVRMLWRESPIGVILHWFQSVAEMAVEVGLWTAPLALVWILGRGVGARRRALVAVAATIATLLLVARGREVPFFLNNVLEVGCQAPRVAVGPLTLRDACDAPHPGLGPLGSFARVALTWAGAASFLSLVVASAGQFLSWKKDRARIDGSSSAHGSLSRGPGSQAIVMLVAIAASYWALVALINVFQRYLLFLVPIVLTSFVLVLRDRPPRDFALAAGAALAFASLLFSVGGVQEYLDWNRARWRAISYLASDLGAHREQIDGGFEFGGWLNFDSRFRHDRRGVSWWWVVEDRYAVAFAPIDGFEVRKLFPYRGWFGLVRSDVLALEASDLGNGVQPRAEKQ